MNCHCCDNKYITESFWHECEQCGHIYRPYEGDVISYHQDEYRKEHPVYPDAERKHFGDTICETISEELNAVCLYPNILFDIGAADGYFANLVNDYFDFLESPVCLEVDEALANKIKEKYSDFNVICEDFFKFESERKYDLVTAIDVLEHLEDIKDFARKAKELTDCLLVIQVPFERKLKTHFEGHLHFFSKESLEKLFEKDFILKKMIRMGQGMTARGVELLAIFEVRRETEK